MSYVYDSLDLKWNKEFWKSLEMRGNNENSKKKYVYVIFLFKKGKIK